MPLTKEMAPDHMQMAGAAHQLEGRRYLTSAWDVVHAEADADVVVVALRNNVAVKNAVTDASLTLNASYAFGSSAEFARLYR